MSKRYSTTTTLVIVESPAKCKKIEEYLGPGYKCMASFGHLRELPSLNNIDFENNFAPTYTIIENDIKKAQIGKLKKAIDESAEVILATDDDREGTAIAWHLAQMFDLDISKTKRIIFNEITESALQKAIQNPQLIDMDMVHAQQARQILDLLVGFKVSPTLWKYIAKQKDNALSAGRCQTPALRLVYDNYKDIQKSPGKMVYNVTGYFTNQCISFELNKQFLNETDTEDVVDFLETSTDFQHMYSVSEPTKIIRPPPQPFTTSRLQQVASNISHISPKETMKLCQTLYEAGYITYMRTDSKVYSNEFVQTAKEYIKKTYSEQYIHPNIDTNANTNVEEELPIELGKKNPTKKLTVKKKDIAVQKLTQDAHEAIRPTNIALKELPDKMEPRVKKMYKIIWQNTLESCMSDASFFSIHAHITAPNDSTYVYKSELIDFPGWKIVEKKYENADPKVNKDYHYLLSLKKGSIMKYKKVAARLTIKDTKMHYTEAKLVQLLEEKGIGRPSTFSSLIDKIQERGYVKKDDVKGTEIICKDYELEGDDVFEIETKREFGNEKGKLIIQPIGILVIDFLDKYFENLFNYDYTRNMEEDLDKIAKNKRVWYELCGDILKNVDGLIEELKGVKKMEIKIDDSHFYIIGKYGPVIKCISQENEVTFKKVKTDIDIHKLENGEYKLEDILDTEQEQIEQNKDLNYKKLGKYEEDDLIIRRGKFGLYAEWGKNTKNLKCFGNRPIENINYADIIQILEKNGNMVREISDTISIKNGKHGDYIFYKTAKMRKPQFFSITECKLDYNKCDKRILLDWLKLSHNI